MASGDDIRADRLKNLELLKLAGMGPYPAHTDKDADITEFLADLDARLDAGTKSKLAGRVMAVFRSMSGMHHFLSR